MSYDSWTETNVEKLEKNIFNHIDLQLNTSPADITNYFLLSDGSKKCS